MSNNYRTEMLAVTKVQELILQSKLLVPYIGSNDKTPSWDGNIIVHSSSENNKKNIRKIPVQVKGKEVQEFSGEITSFLFEVTDLKNYLKDGGIILFVVEIKSNTESRIYYSSLLPIDLKEILKNLSKNEQRTKSLTLYILDNLNKIKLESVCFNFLLHRERQISTIEYSKEIDNLSIEFKEFDFPIIAVEISPVKYILENDVYLYGREHKNSIPIPISKIKIEEVSQKISKEIVVGSEKFFYKCTFAFSHEGTNIIIGNNIRLYGHNAKLYYKIAGNLHERIKDIQFVIALFKNKKMIIDEIIVGGIKDIDDTQIEKFNKCLDYYNDIIALMRLFKINDVLEMDNLNDKDYRNLNSILDIVLYNKKNKYKSKSSGLCRIKIGNINILVLLSLDQKGFCSAENFFDIGKYSFRYTVDSTQESVRCSPYIILKEQYIKEASNFDIEVIEESIKSHPLNELYNVIVTRFILELIKAFDQNNKLINRLSLAFNLCIWLVNYEKCNPIINTINKFQILVRQRPLLKEEEVELIEIKRLSEVNIQILCAINILLNNRTEFAYYFEKLSEEEKALFCEYPIYNLVSNLKL